VTDMRPGDRPGAVTFRANLSDPRHGTVNGYTNLVCRCVDCTAAWRDAHRNYMHADPARSALHAEKERRRRHANRKRTS
jgi:hypothetical protein